MKVLLQRCKHASVSVGGNTIGKIDSGILAFIGIQKHDNNDNVKYMAERILAYRMFMDDQNKMNVNVIEHGGGVLAISQFTLAANTNKGLRPSFSSAAPPSIANAHYDNFVEHLKNRHADVATGEFGADMQVSLTNDGPVTFLLEN